jgi:hypothetical protein
MEVLTLQNMTIYTSAPTFKSLAAQVWSLEFEEPVTEFVRLPVERR